VVEGLVEGVESSAFSDLLLHALPLALAVSRTLGVYDMSFQQELEELQSYNVT
jgi:hypothetical protein